MAPSDFNKGYEDSSDKLNNLMQFLMVFSIALYVLTQGGLAMKYMFILVRAM